MLSLAPSASIFRDESFFKIRRIFLSPFLAPSDFSDFHDFLESQLVFKQPSADEQIPLVELIKKLEGLNDNWDASEIQQIILDVGKTNGFENNRDWFKLIYEVLLGSQSGPRLGSFFALLGKEKTVEKFNKVLK